MVENLARKIESNKNAVAGTSVDISEKEGLAELLRNPEDNQQFSYYLASLKKKTLLDAFTRLEAGHPWKRDIELIEKQYLEFTERRERFEKVEKALSVFTNDMLTHSPIFKQFRDFNGGDNIRTVLERGLRDMALTNDPEFARVERQLKRLLDQQAEEKKLDDRISKWCAANKVPESKELLDALEHKSEHDRFNALQHLLIKDFSWKQTLGDWFKERVGRGTWAKAKEISDLGSLNVPFLNAERARKSEEVGNYMRDLLVNNKEMRIALARAHRGDEIIFPKGSEALPTLEKMRNDAKTLTRDAKLDRAKTFKATHVDAFADIKTLLASTDPAKQVQGKKDLQTLHDTYATEEAILDKEFKRRPGFMAQLINALTSIFSVESRGKLKPGFESILQP